MFQQTIFYYQMVCIYICWFVIFWDRFWDHLFFDFSVPPNFMIFIHRFHHSFLSAKRVHHGVLVGLVFDSFSSAFKWRVVVMMK
jgi:hypothetical protein